MRKIKILFLSLITLLCAIFGVACGAVNTNLTYELLLDDPNGYVLEDVSGYYAFGAELTLKIAFTSDVEVQPYLNGEELKNGELVEKYGTYYYEFTFKMPPRPSKIQISPPYDFENEDVAPLPPIEIEGTKNTIFTVGYDYGNHKQTEDGQGVATLLLDSCLPFFDLNDYNLAMPILAGDELTVYYTGEMYEQETFPGEIVIKNGEVKWVEKSRHAQLMEVSCANGEIIGRKYFAEWTSHVVNIDGTCTPLGAIPDGTRLYAAYVEEYVPGSLPMPDEEGVCIQPDVMEVVTRLTGLYSYNPDYAVPIQELLPWTDEIAASSVEKISVRTSNPSVGPNGLITIDQTTNESEMQSFIENLKNLSFRRVSKAEGEVDGGTLVEYTITTKDGKAYQYSTYAGYYYADETYRPSSSEPPVFAKGQTYYQFPDILSSAKLYVNGNFAQTYEDILSDVTFQRAAPTGEWGEPAQKLVLDADGVLVYLLSNRTFYFEGGAYAGILYEIVGEKDFQQIFDDYVTTA